MIIETILSGLMQKRKEQAATEPQHIRAANNDKIALNNGYDITEYNTVGYYQMGDYDGASPINGRDDIVSGGVVGNPVFVQQYQPGAAAAYNRKVIRVMSENEISSDIVREYNANIVEW